MKIRVDCRSDQEHGAHIYRALRLRFNRSHLTIKLIRRVLSFAIDLDDMGEAVWSDSENDATSLRSYRLGELDAVVTLEEFVAAMEAGGG